MQEFIEAHSGHEASQMQESSLSHMVLNEVSKFKQPETKEMSTSLSQTLPALEIEDNDTAIAQSKTESPEALTENSDRQVGSTRGTKLERESTDTNSNDNAEGGDTDDSDLSSCRRLQLEGYKIYCKPEKDSPGSSKLNLKELYEREIESSEGTKGTRGTKGSSKRHSKK